MAINNKPDIHNLVLCANVFIRKDGKWLLMKRSPLKKYAPNKIHPFGGKIDPDENPYKAAVREVKEETGLSIKNLKLEAVVNELKPDDRSPENWLIFHFSADYESGELLHTEEGEVVYLTDKELVKANLFPSVEKIIRHIVNPDDGTVFTTNKYDSYEDGICELDKDICKL